LTYAFLSLFLLLAAYAALSRRRHVRLKSACLAAFTRIYASTSPAPTFEMAYSYGEPAFQIGFPSQAAMASAGEAGANGAFLRAVDELCKDRGRQRRPFKAERAVYFTHPPVARPDRKIHCCAQMQAQADLADASGRWISYSTRSDAYALGRDAAGGAVAIEFCPWCGTRLQGADQTKSRAL
jgi:hypothetical protein